MTTTFNTDDDFTKKYLIFVRASTQTYIGGNQHNGITVNYNFENIDREYDPTIYPRPSFFNSRPFIELINKYEYVNDVIVAANRLGFKIIKEEPVYEKGHPNPIGYFYILGTDLINVNDDTIKYIQQLQDQYNQKEQERKEIAAARLKQQQQRKKEIAAARLKQEQQRKHEQEVEAQLKAREQKELEDAQRKSNIVHSLIITALVIGLIVVLY